MPTPLLAGDVSQCNIADISKYLGIVTFGATSIESQIGRPAVVARTGAGAYTITFPMQYNSIVNFTAPTQRNLDL